MSGLQGISVGINGADIPISQPYGFRGFSIDISNNIQLCNASGMLGASLWMDVNFVVKVTDIVGARLAGVSVVVSLNDDETIYTTVTDFDGYARFYIEDQSSEVNVNASKTLYITSDEDLGVFSSYDGALYEVILDYVNGDCIYKIGNKNNFTRWMQLSGVSLGEEIPTQVCNGSVIISERDICAMNDNIRYAPKYAQGELAGFYINFDEPLALTYPAGYDISDWYTLYIINENSQVVANLGYMTLHSVGVETPTSGFYNLYKSFTFPSVGLGYYRFVITGVSRTLWASNCFKVVTADCNTKYVEYRNDSMVRNYYYEDITSFYNRLRLNLTIRDPEYKEIIDGYEKSDGEFIEVKSTEKKYLTVYTDFFDELAHDAMKTMLRHKTIIIDGIEYERDKDSDYSIEWVENYPFAEGTCKLVDSAYTDHIKYCS